MSDKPGLSRDMPIGVFDSGIGGLSVLRQLIRFLPGEKFIYLGDTARVPYGNKSKEIIEKYSEECTRFLLSKGCKMIVAACNTASALGIERVIQIAGDTPVIGMIEPAANAALRSTNKKKIGIIGTRATILSSSYKQAINSLNNEVTVLPKECPLFVPLVEEGWIYHNVTREIAAEYLNPLINSGIDTLVLGCTHYPLLSRLLNELLPEVTLIDSGEHAAVEILRLLAELKLLNEENKEIMSKPEIEFFVTDLPQRFDELARNFLGFDISKPSIVNLELI